MDLTDGTRSIDLVYESVGGEMLEAAVANLAVKGRVVIIGAISGYSDGSAFGKGTRTADTRRAPLTVRAA